MTAKLLPFAAKIIVVGAKQCISRNVFLVNKIVYLYIRYHDT